MVAAASLSLQSDMYHFLTHPPGWIREISTKIYIDSTYNEIGRIDGFLIQYRQLLNDKANLYKIFASIDEHAALAYQSFFQPSFVLQEVIESVYYIKAFFINEDKRGQGIGSKTVSQLPEYLSGLTHTTLTHLFLYPFPLSRNRYGCIVPDRSLPEKIPLLKKFYESNGFVEMSSGEFGACLYLKEV